MVYQITENIFVIGKTIIKSDKQFSFMAYLIKGKVNVLIDTLPLRSAELLSKEVKKLLKNERLHFLILNHSEEDHSGALLAMKREYPEMVVYCTNECQERISEQLAEMECHTVSSGQKAVLGDNVFQFIKTPGLHWNDNMVTYFEKEKILFSNDLFGQLLASETPTDSEYTEDFFIKALDAYYTRVFSEATSEQKKNVICILNYSIRMIAPGHGVLIEKMLQPTLNFYHKVLTE